jgi:hypothetical protein
VLEIYVEPGPNFNEFYLSSAAKKKGVSDVELVEIRKNIMDAMSFLEWRDKII